MIINETQLYVDIANPLIQQVVGPFHFSITLNYTTKKFTVNPRAMDLSIATLIDCLILYCKRQEVMNTYHGQS